MAASDNVVRAGLTPKLKDVGTLTEMLTYVDGATHSWSLARSIRQGQWPKPRGTRRLAKNSSSIELHCLQEVTRLTGGSGISILIVVEGQGELIASHASGHLSGDLLSEAAPSARSTTNSCPMTSSHAPSRRRYLRHRPGWVIR